MAMPLCGIDAVFFYSSSFFSGDARIGIALVGAVNVVTTIIALFLMDRWGRRAVSFYSVFKYYAFLST